MKKTTLKLALVLSFVLGYSCSNQSEIDNQKFGQDLMARGLPDNVEIDNRVYFMDGEFAVNELVDGILESYFLLSENNIQTELIDENTSDDFIISNTDTNELIFVKNIVRYNDYFTFDAESNGREVKNFTYHFEEEQQGFSNRNPGVIARAVLTIAVAVIASMQDTPLEQCRGAMSALNCGSKLRTWNSV
ncbi:hypothetical protein [Flavobacterium sp. UBA6135]|uniref:hypothetical protein n=1 Tax=Flavobacterium sp. UBA6135 TaxID=1946553 RepID=UPI0025BB18D4|nr:hypothetical protein [Flavobacterium sp. UBA6135]